MGQNRTKADVKAIERIRAARKTGWKMSQDGWLHLSQGPFIAYVAPINWHNNCTVYEWDVSFRNADGSSGTNFESGECESQTEAMSICEAVLKRVAA